MPYASISNLPKAVREHLLREAQRIYRAAFNNAWEQYADRASRQGGASREETAHRVAWAAVKKEYAKSGDHWVARKGPSRVQ